MPPLDGPLIAPPAAPSPLADAFLRHESWLLDALTRRYGPTAAADIAQETFLRARTVPYETVRHPRALLLKIAMNLASNRFRKASREVLVDPRDPVFERAPAPPSQDEAAFFVQMIMALTPKLRDVFVLSHVKGLSYREIAQLRGISVKAVEKRMSLAIAKCAELMRG
ncbi:RNA polymerase sigma factor [Caulobacter sp. 602-2]|uniref:RNA polymerase sigma factor n=1 Tax=Caulobacter sp. 602-2 TaxID=2710887 RepID=A0A6G4QVL5_9CAUL|nr:RNA polymerase sigma factor [Caulobacter sp. 602-2]NGM49374.1 RNA polymerase sigma factor [Caulobacter sp. 602-2]